MVPSEGVGGEEWFRPVTHKGLVDDHPVRIADQLIRIRTEAGP
jgi:hypothetical protein